MDKVPREPLVILWPRLIRGALWLAAINYGVAVMILVFGAVLHPALAGSQVWALFVVSGTSLLVQAGLMEMMQRSMADTAAQPIARGRRRGAGAWRFHAPHGRHVARRRRAADLPLFLRGARVQGSG
ncbi:MAG: hypothetical protein KDH20_07615 [Rhodocyclaceae bacterium]|nr:hypothetical protein [Rhodocyclaceae bacterium]MCB1962806.1 hypothetical protein [Rhodocyclaceae bacterium]